MGNTRSESCRDFAYDECDKRASDGTRIGSAGTPKTLPLTIGAFAKKQNDGCDATNGKSGVEGGDNSGKDAEEPGAAIGCQSTLPERPKTNRYQTTTCVQNLGERIPERRAGTEPFPP